jgi:hypothetical protein
MAAFDVSVVIPCRNERASIGACVDEARAAIEAAGVFGEVVVVDNGSTDDTAARARAAGARVVTELRPGYGSAYLAGLDAATGRAILMGDGDGTYDFSELPRFLALLDGGADLVLGSRLRGRILPGSMPWHHRWIGNPVLTGILNLVFRARVSDAHCGLRMLRRGTLQRLGLRSTGMEFASEMVVRAAATGLRIAETPIVYRARPAEGRSKLRSVRDGLRHLRLMAALAPRIALLGPAALIGAVGLSLLVAGANDAVELAGACVLAGAAVGADLVRGRPPRPAALVRPPERSGRRAGPIGVALRFAVALGAVAAALALLDEPRPDALTSDAGRFAVAMLTLSGVALAQTAWLLRNRRRVPSGG